MVTTVAKTWVNLFGERFEDSYGTVLTKEQFMEKVQGVLSEYELEIVGNGDIIGEYNGMWRNFTEEDWAEIKEELQMI